MIENEGKPELQKAVQWDLPLEDNIHDLLEESVNPKQQQEEKIERIPIHE